jgi:hypothetical protein
VTNAKILTGGSQIRKAAAERISDTAIGSDHASLPEAVTRVIKRTRTQTKGVPATAPSNTESYDQAEVLRPANIYEASAETAPGPLGDIWSYEGWVMPTVIPPYRHYHLPSGTWMDFPEMRLAPRSDRAREPRDDGQKEADKE